MAIATAASLTALASKFGPQLVKMLPYLFGFQILSGFGNQAGQRNLTKKQMDLELKKLEMDAEAKKAFLSYTRQNTEKNYRRASREKDSNRTWQTVERANDRIANRENQQNAMMMGIINQAMKIGDNHQFAPINNQTPMYNLIRR